MVMVLNEGRSVQQSRERALIFVDAALIPAIEAVDAKITRKHYRDYIRVFETGVFPLPKSRFGAILSLSIMKM